VLACPNPEQQFFLEVDTSSFTLGAVLFQKEAMGWQRDVAYLSKALSQTEQNYDIWDREFLAIVVAFRAWHHLLAGTKDPVQVLTDHANLQYYQHLQKINLQVAQYINFLEDFNYQLKHIPGIHNQADALSHRPDHNNGMVDNKQVITLPDKLFMRALTTAMLDKKIRWQQWESLQQVNDWAHKYQLQRKDNGAWYKGDTLVVVKDNGQQKALLEQYHNTPTAGHTGTNKTI
jgi:hypothetical protein